jgi:phasin
MIGSAPEIPSQTRDIAEKSVEQAREAFLGFMGAARAAEKGVEQAREAFLRFMGVARAAMRATETFSSGAKDAMTRATSFAEDNVKAGLDLAQKLVNVKDVQEILALQTEFAKSQLAAMQTQAKELGAVAQEPIAPETKN